MRTKCKLLFLLLIVLFVADVEALETKCLVYVGTYTGKEEKQA